MKFEKIFTTSPEKLKTALAKELTAYGYTKIHNLKQFLYVSGNAPYMLVAHLDTVHKQLPSVICYSKDGNYIMSPQGIGGDDRCGVYIILELLKRLPFKPHILFTMDEEIGCVGAQAFVNCLSVLKNNPKLNLNYIIEFGRKGNNDAVFYDCDNHDFTKFVESFGFEENYGSFSDISVIAPALGVAAVNLSSGYYNPHQTHEYVSLYDMHSIIDKAEKMLLAESKQFEYIKKVIVRRKVFGSFVPEGELYVYSYADKTFYVNAEHGIIVDR